MKDDVSERRVEQALRLLAQVEAQFAFENGLIDPSDHDRFSCFELLQVADAKITLYDLVWGQGDAPEDIYAQEKREQQQLAEWNAKMATASMTTASAQGEHNE